MTYVYLPEAADLKNNYIFSSVAAANTTPNMEQVMKDCTLP